MLVHKESKSLLLRVQRPDEVKAVIPHNRDINFQGHNLAVRFGLDEVRVLNNMGIRAPSPIRYYYDWPGRFNAFDHQQDTSSLMTIYRRGFILNETGTMKTASALWAADYLMSLGLVQRVLIAAKLSTLDRVWLEEIFRVLMHRSAVVLHGSLDKRLERLARPIDFYIINHEGVELIANDLAQRKDIDLIIYDEASELRNASTNKWKAFNALINPNNQPSHHRVWLMTATPCPTAPTDAWALTKLVNPRRVPKWFGQWKRQTMLKVSTYKWVPRHEAIVMAYNAMQPAIRYRKKDCLHLPPLVTEEREAPLSKEQQKAFDQMRLHLVLDLGLDPSKLVKTPEAVRAVVEHGIKSVTVTAVNAADKINKLRQILCGAIKHPETGIYTALDHSPRFKVLIECIEEATAKVIVVVPFKGILQVLADEMQAYRAKHGGDVRFSAEVLNGDVSRVRRNEIITAFKNNDEPNLLLCHPKVMAHGLNLTEADMTIFYAPIYSSDEFAQVIERFNRPGQTRKMTVIRIGATKIPLEWSIYDTLDKRQEGQLNILDLYCNAVALGA